MGKLVVVAEDNRADFELVRMALENCAPDVQVHWVDNGQALLDFLAVTNVYDLCFVLLDLSMPKVGGMDVLRYVAEDARYCTVPFIVFSSSDSADDVLDSYGFRANAFVQKPQTFDEYPRVMTNILEFWSNVNVLAKPEVIDF